MFVEGRGMEPSRLVSCHLIEVASDDSLFWSWSYPHLSNELRSICLNKCKVMVTMQSKLSSSETEAEVPGCRFFHLNNLWFYVYLPSRPLTTSVPESDNMKNFGTVVVAENFNPEMYNRVANILYLTFQKTGDTSLVLQQFLSLVVDGMCLLPKKKTFSLCDYEDSSFDKHQIKEIISTFGLETILIHTGLQRRLRIAVYHYNIDALTEFTLSLPTFYSESKNSNVWNYIYPWVDLNEDEIDYIKSIPFYVIGCTNAGIENRSDLFDIFVNIPAAEITVAPHARENIAMNKTHKELATFMVQLATTENATEQEVVEALTKRTFEIRDKLSNSVRV